MSRDFASFMASITADSAEIKIKELMEILDKVTQIIMNSTDRLFGQFAELESNIHGTMTQIVNLESRPIPTAAAPGQAAPTAPAAAAPAPAPKPAPKPMNPVSARSALQGELKALFAKRKQH